MPPNWAKRKRENDVKKNCPPAGPVVGRPAGRRQSGELRPNQPPARGAERGPQQRRGTIVVAANASWNLVNFRAPIIRALVAQGWRVVAAAPPDDATRELCGIGVEFEPIAVDSKGLSPLNDLALAARYRALLRRVRPDAFLSFTPKPNIFGSIAAQACGVPAIATVTGLGTGFLSGRALQGLVTILYRLAFRRSRRVFFHNSDDLDLFVGKRLVAEGRAALVAGSGIDLAHFAPAGRKAAGRPPVFLFIGRFLRDKGVEEFIAAAGLVKRERQAAFQMIGAIEDHPKGASRELVEAAAARGDVELLGTTGDVRPFIANADCVVLPSYREGLPRVLLEAGAMATPVIASDVPGCRQAVDDGVTGLLCEARSAGSLAAAITQFADMGFEEQAAMGDKGRAKAEREFSQERVVAAYLDALEGLGG